MRRHGLQVVVLLGIAMGLYGTSLGVRPMRLDELRLRTQSQALAEHGVRDDAGRLFPVFVHVSGEVWLAPLPVYASMLADKVLPMEASNVRWSAAVFGSLSVVLMYVLANLLLQHRTAAFAAALVLLTTPSHFVYSRLATNDGIWQLPLILIWLIGLAAFVQDPCGRSRWPLAAGAAALAGSVYSQPSACVMAPLFFGISAVALWRTPGWRRMDVAVALVAFFVVLVPLMLWFVANPATYVDTLGRWLLHPAHLRNPIVWAAAASNWLTLTIWADVFWKFFAPSFLFFNPAAPAFGGVFALPLALMIVAGVAAIVRQRRAAKEPAARGAIDGVILAGFLVGPLAVATFKEPPAIEHALVMAPFGVLLAVLGVGALWAKANTANRVLTALLLIAVPFQFLLAYRRLAVSPESPVTVTVHATPSNVR